MVSEIQPNRTTPVLPLVNGSSRLEFGRRAFLLPLVLVLMTVPMPTLEVLKTTVGNPRAFAITNGVEHPIRVGDVVAQGTLVGLGTDSYCDMPEAAYGLAGSSEGQASITLQITTDCQLVVASIDFARNDLHGTTFESDSMDPHSADSHGVRTFVTTGPDTD